MSNAIFPDFAGLEYPVVRTPIFKTLIQQAASGQENRAALQVYPRWQYTLSFNFLRDDGTDEFRTLCAFFLARRGSFDSFLYSDPDDNHVTNQPIGIGNGTQTAFQLARPFGGFDEPVLAPKLVSSVTVAGISKVDGTDYGVGGWENGISPNGTVNFFPGHVPAAGQAIVASFSYYWPVRFLNDQYDFSKFMNRLWEQKKLDFITLKNG
jgi:uncharacterized protein (TIGR02217 family)